MYVTRLAGNVSKSEKFVGTALSLPASVYLPTIGRFAQVDPIPGGNANDYAYAVDPINSHDFSGRCLQCGAGASFVQNAAGASRVQNAAPTQRVQATSPAQYFQPAVSMRAVQTITKVNLPIVRPAAPKRNDTYRMPVATVKGVPLLEINKHYVPPSVPSGEGYTKITFGPSFIFGTGTGVIITNQGQFYRYSYTNISTPKGLDATVVFSNSKVQCGWSTSAGGFAGIGGNIGSDGAVEVGFGTAGVSTERGYVHC